MKKILYFLLAANHAFSVNNEHKRLDTFHFMTVAKYFRTQKDFMNAEMTCKKLGSNVPKEFHYNPISVTPTTAKIFPKLETLHLYTERDIQKWVDNDRVFHRIEVWIEKSYSEAQTLYQKLSPKTKTIVSFHNVYPDPAFNRDFAVLNDGVLSFNEPYFIDPVSKQKSYFNIKACPAICGRTDVKRIIAPRYIEHICDYTFRNAFKLESIVIPNSVLSIGRCAFFHCSSLTEFIMPDNVIEVGSHVFNSCTSLKNVHISTKLQEIPSSMFDRCSSLEKIEIPESVEWIHGEAFNKCTSLKEIIIPKNVRGIGNCVFQGCINLKSIEIPQSVTTMSMRIFEDCINLTSVTMPSNLKIWGDTFDGCSNLKEIIKK